MCVYDSAMSEKYGDAQPEPGALQIRSPLSPTLTLMVEGILRRRRGEIAQGTLLLESCAPSGGWTNALTLNLNRLSDTDTGKSSLHQITRRESCPGTRPSAFWGVWASLPCNLITGALQWLLHWGQRWTLKENYTENLQKFGAQDRTERYKHLERPQDLM